MGRLDRRTDDQGAAQPLLAAVRDDRHTQQVIRISEALIDVYMHVRQGKQTHALGRLALLLAAIEQASLDNGDWSVRAGTILGLPEPTFNEYSQPEARHKPKQGKAMGARGKLAGFSRSAVAEQVFKESSGLLDK